MIRIRFTSVAFFLALLSGVAGAQSIKSPFPFVQSGADTSASQVLSQLAPQIPMARVYSENGHFKVGLPDKQPQRIRFFGTELDYTTQFLNGTDAKILAKRLHKLGF